MIAFAPHRRRLLLDPELVTDWKKVGGANRYQASCHDTPTDVYINGSLGVRKFSQKEVADIMDWYWDEKAMKLYVSTLDVAVKAYCQ